MASLIPYEVTTVPGMNATPSYENEFYAIGWKTYVEVVFMCFFGAVGTIGNGTLILIVLLNADMRNVPNTLIASLALGDFVFLAWNVPFTIASYFHYTYPFSMFVCKMSSAIPILSEGVSVLTLGALSFDRYNAIVRPMHRRRSNAVVQTYLLALIIWVVATALAVPSFIIAKRVDDVIPLCYSLPFGQPISIVHEIFRFLVLYVFPLIVISLFYTLIALQLLASSRDMPGESRGDATKQVKARRRLARSVIVLVALFAICWFPHFVYQFIFQFKFSMDEEDLAFLGSLPMSILQTVSHNLIYINSSINPIAMCFLSQTYRSYFSHYLCYCIPSKRREPVQRGRMSKNGMAGNNSKWTTEGSMPPSAVETKTCVL